MHFIDMHIFLELEYLLCVFCFKFEMFTPILAVFLFSFVSISWSII